MNDQNKQNNQNVFFPSDEPPIDEVLIEPSNSQNSISNTKSGDLIISQSQKSENTDNVYNLPTEQQSEPQSLDILSNNNQLQRSTISQENLKNNTLKTSDEDFISQTNKDVFVRGRLPNDNESSREQRENLFDILEKKVQKDLEKQDGLSEASPELQQEYPPQNATDLRVSNFEHNQVDVNTDTEPVRENVNQNNNEVFSNPIPEAQKTSLIVENFQNIPQAGPPIPQASNVVSQKDQNNKFPKLVVFVLIGLILIFVLALFGFMIYRNAKQVKTVGTKGEVVWWGLTMDEATIIPLIEQFESENPGVDVTYIKQSPKDYRERLINALASGKGPDIFEIHNTWPAMFAPYLSALPESVMTKSQFNSSFYPIMTSDLVLPNKGVIAMPLVYDALALYINTDVFNAAAIEPPKYWSDLQSIVDSGVFFQVDSQSQKILQSPIAFGITNNVDYWPEVIGLMMYQNKVDFSNLNSQPMIDIFNFYKYFNDVKKVWNSSMPNSTIAFAKNQLAMYFGPTRRAQEIVQINPSLRFKTVFLPQIEPEKPTDPVYSYATYWAYGVYEKSTNAQLAWEFLKFLSSEESLKKLNQTLESQDKLPVLTSRPDLNLIYAEHPVLGSVFALSKNARSWYLASETHDGATGINSQLNKLFEAQMAANDLAFNSKVISLLAQFGIRQTRTF